MPEDEFVPEVTFEDGQRIGFMQGYAINAIQTAVASIEPLYHFNGIPVREFLKAYIASTPEQELQDTMDLFAVLSAELEELVEEFHAKHPQNPEADQPFDIE
jgi:hypothetical protein